jgi:HlyD family secretion protein
MTLGVVALVAAVTAAAAWLVLRPAKQPSGILEVNGRVGGDESAVGPRVGGKVVGLRVREGERLDSGALIAELASDQLRAQLAQAEHAVHTAREELGEAHARLASALREVETADLAVTHARQEARARIGEAQAALGAVRARLTEAEASRKNAERDFVRTRELYAKELIAAQQLDQARTRFEVARAGAEAARQRVGQAEEALALARASLTAAEVLEGRAQTARERVREARAAIETARARIEVAEANRAVARASVEDTRVLAPFAGTVLRKLVEPGEVVAAGTPLVLFVDLSRLHAKVYVAEADLGKVKVGDPARVYTDAFPGRAFDARVAEVAQHAEFTPRDVHMKDERAKLVFAVKLAIDNPEGILKPGMPVDALIRWRSDASWPESRSHSR